MYFLGLNINRVQLQADKHLNSIGIDTETKVDRVAGVCLKSKSSEEVEAMAGCP